MIGSGLPPVYGAGWSTGYQTKSFSPPVSPNGWVRQHWRPVLNPMMGPSTLLPPVKVANTPPVNLPVQAPPSNDDLQQKYPGLYARLAKNQLVEDLKPDLVGVAKTLGQVSRQQPVKDSSMADLDDNMKRFGSLAIASLATLGLKQKILGVGEYVGFLSWFAAMAATPTVINNMVRLKTGVNLGQKYDSTYGERLNIFKDPNYLPLHILPPDEMAKVAKRLNVPPGPNQRLETEEKMRQISVQTHTWWMLMAGPATPVISGLVADNLQQPVIRGYNWLGSHFASWRAKQSLSKASDAVFESRLKGAVDRLTGGLPESELTSWWKDFGEAITKETGLRNALTRKEVMDEGEYLLSDKITRYFTNEARDKQRPVAGFTKEKADRTLAYLARQYEVIEKFDENGKPIREYGGKLGALREKALGLLQGFEEQLEAERKATQDAEKLTKLQKRIDRVRWYAAEVDKNIVNAGSTVQHYQATMKKALKTFEADLAKDKLDKAVHKIRLNLDNSNVTHLLDQKLQGQSQVARQLGRSAFAELENAMAGGQTHTVSKLMGANPKTHLMRVLRDVKAHSMWRNRMVYGLGGALFAASALYTTVMVGRNFKPAAPPPPNPQGGQG
ncbi:hypothetical protein [Vampirovibrio chlorellavorus]|uniref:hypothetical protein n=1 Tax=Vampirovibrio chlorellavorus TaxID=758823 RepID=UPI0026EC702B|nr:hypothetical protein [Vampirovibrio chlorellavorus]